MANVIIKKRVALGFLGEDYTEGYLVFKAPGIDEIAEVEAKADKLDQEDTQKSLDFLKSFLAGRLLGGEFPNVEEENKLEEFTKDDIGKLDGGTIITVFQVLGGGIASDPKGQSN